MNNIKKFAEFVNENLNEGELPSWVQSGPYTTLSDVFRDGGGYDTNGKELTMADVNKNYKPALKYLGVRSIADMVMVATTNDDEKFLLRLESEYIGYLTPLANNYSNLSRGKINNIYIKLFFRNTISWLFLSLKYHGKKKTFERIKEIRNIIKEPFTVKISSFLFSIFPIFLFDFLRILRKKIIKQT